MTIPAMVIESAFDSVRSPRSPPLTPLGLQVVRYSGMYPLCYLLRNPSRLCKAPQDPPIAPLQGTSRSSNPSSLSRLSSPAHNSSFPPLTRSLLVALLTSPLARLHSLALPPDLCISFHKPCPYLRSCHLSPLTSPFTLLYLRLGFVFA